MDDTHERIKAIIDNLPVLSRLDLIDSDDSCPICLVPFTSLLQDNNSGAGVTKLTACNHIFCRKDLQQWIESRHGSCPTCRHSFLNIRPPSESDDESSDGGEYIPNEQEEEFDDDDVYIDTDWFSDAADFAADPVELELDVWEGGGHGSDVDVEDEDMENGTDWGLSDEDSSSMSDDGTESALSEDGGVGVALEMGVDVQNENESDGNEDYCQEGLTQEPK